MIKLVNSLKREDLPRKEAVQMVREYCAGQPSVGSGTPSGPDTTAGTNKIEDRNPAKIICGCLGGLFAVIVVVLLILFVHNCLGRRQGQPQWLDHAQNWVSGFGKAQPTPDGAQEFGAAGTMPATSGTSAATQGTTQQWPGCHTTKQSFGKKDDTVQNLLPRVSDSLSEAHAASKHAMGRVMPNITSQSTRQDIRVTHLPKPGERGNLGLTNMSPHTEWREEDVKRV